MFLTFLIEFDSKKPTIDNFPSLFNCLFPSLFYFNSFFRYRKLILGFNTFLPEGHKINNSDIERSENEYRLAEEERRANEMRIQQGGAASMQQPGYPGGMQPGMSAMAQPAAAPQPPQHQEFDHAISYVTNIKQRFANEPDTYKAFLDILHAYQRDQSRPKEEQKGIQEVLDKVSELFAEHPDLLKEFTYFLPDAVQVYFLMLIHYMIFLSI